MGWTERLWADVEPVYAAIVGHPFLAGLADGTLPAATFAEYLAQDAHYLRDYSRALALVGARAPTHALTGVFAAHAVETVEVELALHEQLLPQLGLDAAALERVTPSPTTTAYTSYLLRAAYGGSWITFPDGQRPSRVVTTLDGFAIVVSHFVYRDCLSRI